MRQGITAKVMLILMSFPSSSPSNYEIMSSTSNLKVSLSILSSLYISKGLLILPIANHRS